MPSAVSPLGPQALSPRSPPWSSSLLGGNSVGESDGLPIAAASWLPERFSLAGEQWKPQDYKGRCQQERQARPEDTHRERHRLPKGKFAQLTQLCSCWAKRTHVPGPRALGRSCSWLIRALVLEGQEQTGFKAKDLAGGGGPVLHLCPLSLPAHIRP